MGPTAYQTRRQVLKPRQFHLQAAFTAFGALFEYIEDELGAVHHRKPHDLRNIAFLRS